MTREGRKTHAEGPHNSLQTAHPGLRLEEKLHGVPQATENPLLGAALATRHIFGGGRPQMRS